MPIREPILRQTSYTDGQTVTPNDVTTIKLFDGIMVAAAGNVSVELAEGTVLAIPGLQPGIIYPIAGVRVMATGTTATGIVVLR